MQWVLAGVVAVVAAACGYAPLPPPIRDNPGPDASADAPPDAVLDARIDAPIDMMADASVLQFRSCAALGPTCGTGANDDCCHGLEVPGGDFYRSYDLGADGLLGNMGFPAHVSRFSLDKYEVTVGRFRSFVNAGMGTQSTAPAPGAGTRATLSGTGWDATWNTLLAANTAALINAVKCDALQAWTDAPGANESRPMNCITWYDAMAFCIWDGGFLPTETEWNYAAAGGDQQRAYPWSNPANSLVIDSSYASYYDGTTCMGDGMPGCAISDLGAVGTKPAGDARWGHSDLGGNVYEWTFDWFALPYKNPCSDCANLTVAAGRSLRGGAFLDVARDARAGFRDNLPPSGRGANLGVRCARNP